MKRRDFLKATALSVLYSAIPASVIISEEVKEEPVVKTLVSNNCPDEKHVWVTCMRNYTDKWMEEEISLSDLSDHILTTRKQSSWIFLPKAYG